MSSSILVDKSKDFTNRIIACCRVLRERKVEYSLVDQLLRAGTSVGANIAEAKYGNGPADFANKMHTALKECNETKFWLELFVPENEEQADLLRKMKRLNGNIMRMLIQSLNTVKARADWKR